MSMNTVTVRYDGKQGNVVPAARTPRLVKDMQGDIGKYREGR
ncbi:hypothetical protein ACFTY7_44025 [Streptomyces sp. NPDC057062]